MSANTYTIYDFDLKTLLKPDDLNIRFFAKNNEQIRAGEYFKMLSRFLDLALSVSLSLMNYADGTEGLDDKENIDEMSCLLREMGCDRFIEDFSAIVAAGRRGDQTAAANHAKKIYDDFNNLHTQIEASKGAKISSGSAMDKTLLACVREFDRNRASRELLVLAVDDSPAILESVAAVLNGKYKVFKLPKPTMLVNVLKNITPDLFLLDYQMPELDGFELISIIRGHKEHKHTPIIFLTSEGTVDTVTAVIGFGASDFIVKPFNPELLLDKVAKHIVR
jgi:CheY-like chemotaxis protein